MLTVDDVNLMSCPAAQIVWLEDDEIGIYMKNGTGLTDTAPNIEAECTLYTGGPWFDKWEAKRKIDEEYA